MLQEEYTATTHCREGYKITFEGEQMNLAVFCRRLGYQITEGRKSTRAYNYIVNCIRKRGLSPEYVAERIAEHLKSGMRKYSKLLTPVDQLAEATPERQADIDRWMGWVYSWPVKRGVSQRLYKKHGRKHERFVETYQDTAYKLYERLRRDDKLSFTSVAHLASYFTMAVTNNITQFFTTPEHRSTYSYNIVRGEEGDEFINSLPQEVEDTDMDDEDKAFYNALWKEIATMKPHTQQILAMLMEGESYAKIAEAVGANTSTVKTRVRSARQRLDEVARKHGRNFWSATTPK